MKRLTPSQKMILYELINKNVSINKISKIMNLAKSTIYYHYVKIKGKLYTCGVIPTDDKIKGEFLGAFAGDGSYFFDPKTCHHTICIHLSRKDDAEYADYLRKLLQKNFQKHVNTYFRDSRLILRVYSRKIYDFISENLYLGKYKTLEVCLRYSVSYYNISFLTRFVRGLFDTDGYVSKSGKVCIGIIAKNLIIQISKILNNLQIKHSVLTPKVRPNERQIYRINIMKQSNPKFLTLIGFSNPRKELRLKNAVGGT